LTLGQRLCSVKKASAKSCQQVHSGQPYPCRPMQVKRIKNKLHIGTWNVLTLRGLGKMQELAEQVKETRIQILAVRETRA
jgi:hypothetical protein